jgi:predicted permease
MKWWQRIFKKKELEERLDRELRFHFDCQVADNIRAGMGEEEARRSARLKFGGMEGLKEECRDARGTALVDSTMQDIRYSLRGFKKSPAFTAAALCTLALGIGANTAIFQLLDAVRLRNLPVVNPQQLARIEIRNGTGGFGGITRVANSLTNPLWEEIRDHQEAFSGVFAWNRKVLRIGEGAQAHRASGLLVSGDFFSALQLQPAAGRLLNRADDQRGCTAPGVVLSYPFWQSQFGGQLSAIGSKLIFLGHPFPVIGVTPARFSGLEVGQKFDVALPICTYGMIDDGIFKRRDLFWLTVMGRLKPGRSFAQASGHLQAISPGIFETTAPAGYSATSLEKYKKFGLQAVPAGNGVSELRDQYDTSLWLLLGITCLVLLIACANLGNLTLARASARQREFALRLALGASRGRLIRQSLSESLLLGVVGAALGLTVAGVLSKTVVSFLNAEGDSVHLDLSMDWRMLAFTISVAVFACLLFGLAPALRSSRTEPGTAIKSEGRGLTADRERFSLQRLLVVVQIAVSLTLVAGALLFVRSFRNLMTLDPGFRRQGILLAFFDLTNLRLPPAGIKPFEQQMLDEVRSIPQVEGAATTTHVLIGGGSWTLGVHIGSMEGQSKFTWVSPGCFQTLGTPILAGRDFNRNDTETAARVAIVNQMFVRRFLGGADPIGKTFRTSPEPNYPETEYQIVGVIKDTRYQELRQAMPPISYAPATQYTDKGPWSIMYIRSPVSLSALSAAIKGRLSQSHPEIAVEFQPFQAQVEEGLIRERLMAALSGFFGALAAVLATIGLYGVIAYIAVRRRNEIGIRMALGASRSQVLSLVMREAALVVAAGIGIGAVCSLALAQTAASLLFGLEAYDPLTFVAAAALLAAAAAFGSYLPAHRAARLDPMAALRCD